MELSSFLLLEVRFTVTWHSLHQNLHSFCGERHAKEMRRLGEGEDSQLEGRIWHLVLE